MDDSATTFAVLGAAVVLFVSGKVPVALVAVVVPVALWATDVIALDQAFAGFGDPTVVFIAAMFVVADTLESTGVTTWIGQQLLARSGSGGGGRILVSTMVVCALITAFITPNASVAALIPAVVIIAVRTGQPSSQLLMPLAFAAHGGALLALTGSPVNVLVADAAADAGVGAFGYFEFALVGLPTLVGVVAISTVLGPRVLPRRNGRTMPADFSSLAGTLAQAYQLDGTEELFTRSEGVVEVVVPPRSPLIGQRVFRGMVTESGELLVLAVGRDGTDLGPGEVELRAGDALVLRGSWAAIDRQLDDEVLVVDQPDAVRRQVVPLGLGAWESVAVLVAMVALLVTGALPPSVAALLAAGVLVVLGVTTMERAYRAVSWSTVLLVAGMIPLSTAMQQTDAAQQLADGLVAVVGGAGPYALLTGLFVLIAVLGQLISNTATALIVIPVALSAAAELEVSPRPVLIAVNVAAAAALLTPVATPANMMVMEPGGYRFGDYWKLGLPLLGWFFVVAVGITPLIWRF